MHAVPARLLAIGLIPVLIGLVIACERGFAKTITYENRTGHELEVYEKFAQSESYGRNPEFVIGPNQTKASVAIVGYPELYYEARSRAGEVVFRAVVTPKQLEQAGWLLIMVDQRSGP